MIVKNEREPWLVALELKPAIQGTVSCPQRAGRALEGAGPVKDLLNGEGRSGRFCFLWNRWSSARDLWFSAWRDGKLNSTGHRQAWSQTPSPEARHN